MSLGYIIAEEEERVPLGRVSVLYRAGRAAPLRGGSARQPPGALLERFHDLLRLGPLSRAAREREFDHAFDFNLVETRRQWRG